jgi:hypothetical protein
LTDPRTRLETKVKAYIDALTDEDGITVSTSHYFSEGQQPLADLFKKEKKDLLVVYRWVSRTPHHAASGIYAYTDEVDVGLACIDKRKNASGDMRIRGQILLNSAIEEVEKVVREHSFGSSYVTSRTGRLEPIPVGGNMFMWTAWITVPVRSYVV